MPRYLLSIGLVSGRCTGCKSEFADYVATVQADVARRMGNQSCDARGRGRDWAKQGDKVTGTMIDKAILQGHGLQITRTFRNSEGDVVVTHRCLASWCPKAKKILLYELTSAGERTEALIEIVDGEEHNSGTTIQPNGEQTSGKVIVTKEGKNTRKLKVTEGPATGFEMTWTRKKAE